MSLINSPIRGRQAGTNARLVHWLVLCSLVLGQLAMSASMALAQPSASAQPKVPVCTSTGVIYVAWSEADTNQDRAEHPSEFYLSHAGTCVWCTISPHQLRFDLHRDSLARLGTHGVAGYLPTSHPMRPAFTGNPHAPPRAPPFV